MPRTGKFSSPRRGKFSSPRRGKFSAFFSYFYRKNAKKHSVALIFSVSCSFVDKFPSFGQFFPVILITKNEPREPLPASAFGLGRQNCSLGSFFVIAITGKNCPQTLKFFSSAGNRTNNATKYNFS